MNAPINAMEIDTGAAEVVAFVSSRVGDQQTNWTELVIFYLPGANGRCFLADIVGQTVVTGERIRRRRVYVGSIARALEHFDDGDLFDALKLQAADWMDRNASRVSADIERLRERERRKHSAPIGFLGQGGLIGALRWLYEGHQADVVNVRESNLVDAFAEDFGVPGRTVRESLKNERAGKELPSWCRAFIASLMHFDRAAFHAAKGGA